MTRQEIARIAKDMYDLQNYHRWKFSTNNDKNHKECDKLLIFGQDYPNVWCITRNTFERESNDD